MLKDSELWHATWRQVPRFAQLVQRLCIAATLHVYMHMHACGTTNTSCR